MKRQRRGGERHPGEPRGVKQRAHHENPDRTELVGQRTGERLACAPQQHLDGECQREHIAAPVVGFRHRRQKKPKVERGPKLISPIRHPHSKTT
jgi:hypothetical protein